jgi:hypothetical protein
MSIKQALFNFFENGEKVAAKAVLVHYNNKYRRAQLAFELSFATAVKNQNWQWKLVENELNALLAHGNDPLEWQSALDNEENFTHPFSYYTNKRGEKAYTLSVKVPAKFVAQIEKLPKGTKMDVELVLKTYTGYPTPGKDGVYLEWIELVV